MVFWAKASRAGATFGLNARFDGAPWTGLGLDARHSFYSKMDRSLVLATDIGTRVSTRIESNTCVDAGSNIMLLGCQLNGIQYNASRVSLF